ncbi:DNA glycosylase AlkZ-like family protein [Nocardia farcinica]|uniref:DNA glycosylase AlkZ-like family protein n=1 Tax=Nocardia farcinica TaxID=37329 RepID=UPI00226BC158|nr:crosslink repair DNA glycosylase YcaQ family protein [Nocardia farcinica]
MADPDRPAPVRLLGWYDNALLSHQDRARIVPEGAAAALRSYATMLSPVLVDGFVAGVYKIFPRAGRARLRIVPARAWTAAEREQVAAEAAALLAFLEPELTPSVEILDVGADVRP